MLDGVEDEVWNYVLAEDCENVDWSWLCVYAQAKRRVEEKEYHCSWSGFK